MKNKNKVICASYLLPCFLSTSALVEKKQNNISYIFYSSLGSLADADAGLLYHGWRF